MLDPSYQEHLAQLSVRMMQEGWRAERDGLSGLRDACWKVSRYAAMWSTYRPDGACDASEDDSDPGRWEIPF